MLPHCIAVSSGAPACVAVHTGAWGAMLRLLPALLRPEHAESLRVGRLQPRTQAVRPQRAPQLSVFILTLPLDWWPLRVLPFPSLKYGPHISGHFEPGVPKDSSGCLEIFSYFLFPWHL